MDVQVVVPGVPGQQQIPEAAASGAPQSQPLPASTPGSLQPAPQPHEGSLSPVAAKIFGSNSALPQPDAVNVSYRVVHDPDIIVTVFTDPKTGEEIAQVPAEVMVQMAQFFDKESGVTLDRSA